MSKFLTIAGMLTASLVHCGVEKFECQTPSQQQADAGTNPPNVATGSATGSNSSPLVTKRLKIEDVLGTWEGTWDTQLGRSQRGNAKIEIKINPANLVEWEITANGGYMNEYDPVTGNAMDSHILLNASTNTLPFTVHADKADKLGRVDMEVTAEGKITGEFHGDTPIEGCITADEIVGEFKLQRLIRGSMRLIHTVKPDVDLF